MNATIDYPIDWHDPRKPAGRRCLLPCPVCGARGHKPAVLSMPRVGDPRRRLETFLRCPACSSLFAEDRVPFEYELAPSAWASEFHLEQGAGLDSMIAPILHVPAEPRRSLFEVGCGFGFALHFAQQQRGWIAQGVDPSPIAAEGRRVLGLDIRSSYLTEASDPGSIHDMILASEVIEHLPLAGPALRTMRARLSPHGVVALTTPDAACVSPATDLGILLPLLSPGHHLTLYSATGLEHELRAAGFGYVKIERRGSGLVAWASQQRLTLRPPTEDDRTAYENWLATLANDRALPPSLHDGMAYRLLKARVHAGVLTAARGSFEAVVTACRDRFGLDLSEPPELSAELSRELLSGSPRGIPYNLPGLLFYRGLIEMNGSQPGEGAAWFDAAERVARGCCTFYRGHGIDDGETADLIRSSARLALLAYCHRDPATVVSRMRGSSEVTRETVTELFLRLLDLGHLEAAAAIAEQASSAVLKDIAEGYIALIRWNDPKAAAIAFLNAEQAVAASFPQLSERTQFGLALSLAHEDADAAVACASRLDQSWMLAEVFLHLVNLGHLNQAAALDALVKSGADDQRIATARAALCLHLIDIGRLEPAASVAERARSAVLTSLSQGYIALIHRNDPQAAAIAFRTAERLAGATPSPSLAARLLFGLATSLAHEHPDAAVACASRLDQSWMLAEVFLHLVNLGHLNQAAALDSLVKSGADDPRIATARTALCLHLIDLGELEAAASVAERARSAVLTALSQGYIALIHRNDPQAAAIAFRTAERLAGPTPSPILAERLLFGLATSIASEDPASAVAQVLAAPAAPDWIVRSLFIRLADLGHLAAATALEPLDDSLNLDWQVINARAMIALNHWRDGEGAAELFAAAFGCAQAANIHGDTLWRLKYHEAFAWKSIGRLEPAQAAAKMLLDPRLDLPPVPSVLQEAAHGLQLFDEPAAVAR